MTAKIPLDVAHGRNFEAPPWCYLLWGVPAVLALAASEAYNQAAISVTVAGALWTFSVAWAGVGCLINGRSCGRVHCRIDGIAFPALAIVGALNTTSIITISWNYFWAVFFIILVASFVPEFVWKRYA